MRNESTDLFVYSCTQGVASRTVQMRMAVPPDKMKDFLYYMLPVMNGELSDGTYRASAFVRDNRDECENIRCERGLDENYARYPVGY